MGISNSDRTHCVTFSHKGDLFYAVKSRTYGDAMGAGVSKPEVRCAMSLSQATSLANVATGAKFDNVRVRTIVIKQKAKRK